MGRDVRRVPLDFDWPQGEVWEGYLAPDRLREDDCSACEGGGYGPEARAVADTFYPHMIEWGNTEKANRLAWHDKLGQAEVDNLVAEGRLRQWVSDDSERGGSWQSVPRTAAEVNAQSRRGGVHDAINRMVLIQFRCERLGITTECPVCQGHGSIEKYPGQRAEAEAWEPTEPPKGEGWQMWETTSEGSPMSPVFATPEELADWLATSGASIFGSNTASREQWFKIITGEDFAHVTIAPGVIVM